jgi:hypothetical protein
VRRAFDAPYTAPSWTPAAGPAPGTPVGASGRLAPPDAGAALPANRALPAAPRSPLAGPPRTGYPVVVHCESELLTPRTPRAGGLPGSPHKFGPGMAAGPLVPHSSSGGSESVAAQHSYMMQLASWLAPDPADSYAAMFTSVAVLGMAFVFAFMAADYATWQRTPAGIAAGAAPLALNGQQWGPGSLARWLRFWDMSSATTFNPAYLYAWGARCGRLSRGPAGRAAGGGRGHRRLHQRRRVGAPANSRRHCCGRLVCGLEASVD